MNLRITETGEQIPPVVQETTNQPIVSNYPRSGFNSRPGTYTQSVFRQSLTVVNKHPFVFIALAVASVLFTFLSMEVMRASMRLIPTSYSRLFVDLIIGIITFVVGSVIHYHISGTGTAFAVQSQTEEFRSVAKNPRAWSAVLALSFISGLASFASSIAIIALYSTLSSSIFLLSTWSPVITIPLISLATCRFIFAPLIAATDKTGAIEAMRESIALTQGIARKVFGWTAFVAATSFGAQWLMRVDSSVIGHVAYLIPVFMYVVLGVWYSRRARTLAE